MGEPKARNGRGRCRHRHDDESGRQKSGAGRRTIRLAIGEIDGAVVAPKTGLAAAVIRISHLGRYGHRDRHFARLHNGATHPQDQQDP